jgi:hypothetical protein
MYNKIYKSQQPSSKEIKTLPKFLSNLQPDEDYIDKPELFVAYLTPFMIYLLHRFLILIEKYPQVFLCQTNEASWVGYCFKSANRACAYFKMLGLMDFDQRVWNGPCDYQFSTCFQDPVFREKLLQAIRKHLPILQDRYVSKRRADRNVLLYDHTESIKKNIRIGEDVLSIDKTEERTQKEKNSDKKTLPMGFIIREERRSRDEYRGDYSEIKFYDSIPF